MAHFVRSICLLSLIVLPVSAQGFSISPLSKLQIEGTSSVNSFTCSAKQIQGQGVITNQIKGADSITNKVTLTVPIAGLDCQNRRMNQDLSDALKAKANPNIRFELTQVEVLNLSSAPKGSRRIKATGLLSLAGVTKPISVLVDGFFDERNNLHGTGSVAMLMTDFGVTPPTALLGLVKARNEITIRFHLVAESTL